MSDPPIPLRASSSETLPAIAASNTLWQQITSSVSIYLAGLCFSFYSDSLHAALSSQPFILPQILACCQTQPAVLALKAAQEEAAAAAVLVARQLTSRIESFEPYVFCVSIPEGHRPAARVVSSWRGHMCQCSGMCACV